MRIEYNSAAEFNSALMICFQAGAFTEHNETLSSFVNMVNGLSSGCSCTRKKRSDQVNRLYLTMGNALTDTDKQEFKKFYDAEEIVLKFENEIFLVI